MQNQKTKACIILFLGFIFQFNAQNYIKIKNQEQYGLVDNIINCGWQFNNGIIPIITETESGFINKNGCFLYKCTIVDEDKKTNSGGTPTLRCIFSNHLSYIHTSDNYWTLITDDWKIIKEDIPYFTQSIKGFSNGYLPVYLNGTCGYLNSNGELYFPLIFNNAEDFFNGYACVKYENQDFILDKKGNLFLISNLLKGHKRVYKNILND
ncbi:MAG: WG repeat-containing protein [Treponema sp.]|nr:WG repeat-containing protein [Treponema sp.]